MGKWILTRLKERTTWIGIFSVLAAAGLTLAPEVKEQVLQIGVAVVGLILMIMKERAVE